MSYKLFSLSILESELMEISRKQLTNMP